MQKKSCLFQIMGIVNCTPDSFSTGTGEITSEQSLKLAFDLVENGAEVVDFGAESTRPGAKKVSPEQEWERLEPVLLPFMQSKKDRVKVSVDTRHEQTMLSCAKMGVDFINHVGAPASEAVLAQLSTYPKLNYLASHMVGIPEDMQKTPQKGLAALAAIESWFEETYQVLLKSGFSPGRIWLDPGIGFGKDDSAAFAAIGQCQRWSQKYQLVYGVSRKSLFGRVFGVDLNHRDPVSKTLEISLVMQGSSMIRTHDVAGLSYARRELKEVLPKCTRF